MIDKTDPLASAGGSLIKYIEAKHGGKLELKHDDPRIDYLESYEANNPYDQFRWKRTSYTKTRQVWKFKGRRFDDVSLSSKKERPILLNSRGQNTYNEFDLRAAVPSLHLLLNTGEWVATNETIHLRKDIAKNVGINLPETTDDKNITFRWLFEPTLKSGLAHWERWKRQHKDNSFTYTTEQFVRGWGLMQRRLYPENRTPDNLVINYGYNLSFSIFYWESLLESWVCKALKKKGYLVENAYDCFYSNASISTIIRTINIMATKLYFRYQTEKKKIEKDFPEMTQSSIISSSHIDQVVVDADMARLLLLDDARGRGTIHNTGNSPSNNNNLVNPSNNNLVNPSNNNNLVNPSNGRIPDNALDRLRRRLARKVELVDGKLVRKLKVSKEEKISKSRTGKHYEKIAEALRGKTRPEHAEALRGKTRPDHAEALRGTKRVRAKVHFYLDGVEYITLRDVNYQVTGSRTDISFEKMKKKCSKKGLVLEKRFEREKKNE
ncbi:hypothetical protein FACS189491_06620 [Spirochaetia bacterium]|nr:hypothetical protein FACS189491_06620 [Spirochaetia bacterium]